MVAVVFLLSEFGSLSLWIKVKFCYIRVLVIKIMFGLGPLHFWATQI